MKMKSLMAMAAMAFVFGLSSCGDNDGPAVPETLLADQVVGTYSGTEILTVDGEEDESTQSIVITRSSMLTVDFALPAYGEGMMTIPALPLKNIVLEKDNDGDIAGTFPTGSYTGTVTNSKGEEKTFVVSHFMLLYSLTDKSITIAFKLKYGNMPFDFDGVFYGKRSVLN